MREYGYKSNLDRSYLELDQGGAALSSGLQRGPKAKDVDALSAMSNDIDYIFHHILESRLFASPMICKGKEFNESMGNNDKRKGEPLSYRLSLYRRSTDR